MLYLLDTTAFSDLMREHEGMKTRINRLSADDSVVICTIVAGEIGYGIQRLSAGQKRETLEAKASGLLAALPCEPIPAAAAKEYAALKIARTQKGLAMDENDLWIAATAKSIDATLVTRDSDYRAIDGLRIEDWTA